jgi:hypothetical protein
MACGSARATSSLGPKVQSAGERVRVTLELIRGVPYTCDWSSGGAKEICEVT